MYRCARSLAACAALATGVLLAVAPAAAQQLQRAFPANALRGQLAIGETPEATLNDAPARLAPGVRIRNQDNRIETPAQLQGQRLLVHYTVDLAGLINNVWILREEEAARRPWPTTPEQAARWSFDPIAQVWSRR